MIADFVGIATIALCDSALEDFLPDVHAGHVVFAILLGKPFPTCDQRMGQPQTFTNLLAEILAVTATPGGGIAVRRGHNGGIDAVE